MPDTTVPLGRDDHVGSGSQDGGVEMIGVIGLVGQDMARAQTLDQDLCAANVVFLAGSADQAHRIAQAIGGGVDLGAQAAA